MEKLHHMYFDLQRKLKFYERIQCLLIQKDLRLNQLEYKLSCHNFLTLIAFKKASIGNMTQFNLLIFSLLITPVSSVKTP